MGQKSERAIMEGIKKAKRKADKLLSSKVFEPKNENDYKHNILFKLRIIVEDLATRKVITKRQENELMDILNPIFQKHYGFKGAEDKE